MRDSTEAYNELPGEEVPDETGLGAARAPEEAGGYAELFREAISVLAEQPPILRLGARRFIVVGDTHGFPEVSEWALKLAHEEDVDAVIFIGDYVDRGPRGVENLELLLERLVDERDRVYLLRGNHEDPEMNAAYGFFEEAVRKRGEEYLGYVAALYASMPVAVVAEPIVLVHAGIPCRRCSLSPEDPILLDDLEKEAAKIKNSEEALGLLKTSPLVAQLLWNDPRGTIDWFLPGPRGPGTYLYGKAAWRSFLEANDLGIIIRGHEVVDGTHVWLQDGKQTTLAGEMGLDSLEYSVVTVFSSLYHKRRAAVLLVDLEEGKLRPYIYKGEAREASTRET
ncbi:metallophosphoesterase [Pyrofollis japonicus]|uniref:metallophosphoesterase n=1 Tax=Pyrofollis japonicus TaxID=3060460 RepID=UPI00295B38AD|nr:metallophosphoesterase [Pyrofollis japonicus]BEP16856.1 metallophosphoesterase [Pyrofollis japonicus]